jgi:DivIVA domain-containing protein
MTRADSEQLTPQQVRSATFSSARFGRRGLDEGEVHRFCEWVASGIGRLANDNNLLHAEIARLRERLLDGKGKAGVQPEDGHVQAVQVLSKAQQTADRYVAEAQEYSRELSEDARVRRDEILNEAKMRASMILEEAHNSGTRAADAARNAREPIPDAARRYARIAGQRRRAHPSWGANNPGARQLCGANAFPLVAALVWLCK